MSALEVDTTPTPTPFAAAMVSGETLAALHVSGELDLSTCDELQAAIDDAFALGLPMLRVDLRSLQFIDSTGIGCLLRLAERARREGRELEVRVGGAGLVRRALAAAGVERLLPLAA